MSSSSDAWLQSVGGSSGGGSSSSAWLSQFGSSSSSPRKPASHGESTFLGGLFGGIAHTVEHALSPAARVAHYVEPNWVAPAAKIAENFVQGVYAGSKATVQDEWALAHGKPPMHVLRNIIEPTAKSYEVKYGGLNPADFRPGDVAHNIRKDPFGTVLDVAALGTIPYGGEGAVLRASALTERVGLEETALGRAIGARALRYENPEWNGIGRAPSRNPRRITYAPGGSEGATFPAARARTRRSGSRST